MPAVTTENTSRKSETGVIASSTQNFPSALQGTINPPFTETKERDPSVRKLVLHYHSICMMSSYINHSHEELRAQDYAAGRKPATSGQPTDSLANTLSLNVAINIGDASTFVTNADITGAFRVTDDDATKSFQFRSHSAIAMTGSEGPGGFTTSGNVPEGIAFEEEDLELSSPKDPNALIYMDEVLDMARRWRSPLFLKLR